MEHGIDTFIFGMAPGTDIWAAQEMFALKECGADIDLVCAVPFPGFEKKKDAVFQTVYGSVIAAADQVELFVRSKDYGALMQGTGGW